MQIDLKRYSNRWYSPQGGIFKQFIWYFFNIIFFINPLNPFSSLKIILLRLFGARVGKGVMIKPSVNIKYPWLLEIDDYSWIGENVWIDNLAKVKIGKNCCVSQGVILLTGNHNYKRTTFDLIIGEIILEDGVWLGARSVICPGVICKMNSMLTVNSVATSSMAANQIYRGNPAIQIRTRHITD